MDFLFYSDSIFYCRKLVAQQLGNRKQTGKKILFLSLVVHKISEHKKSQNKQKSPKQNSSPCLKIRTR